MSPNLEPQLPLPLPLQIASAEMEGPTLLIRGEGWSLSATCLWRWVMADGRVVSCEAPNAADMVWDLVGESIVGVDWSGPPILGRDPRMHLASGGTLDVLSDAPFDTWTIHLPGLTLVGPLPWRSR